MDWWAYWLAAAPATATIIMLTPLHGHAGHSRWFRVWVGLVVVLFFTTGLLTRCSVRAGAVAELEQRLFGDEGRAVAVYDDYEGRLLTFAVDGRQDSPSRELTLLAQRASPSARSRPGPGSASLGDYRPIRVTLDGTPREKTKLSLALARLAGTEYGSRVLADILRREDVVISFSDEIGVTLPTGHTVTTGGSAVTMGSHVYLSRHHYGNSSTAVLAAMIAHEFAHVVQNEATGSAWWQWPWATVEREESAHLLQAIVWAEVRGSERDESQETILESALNRGGLRQYINDNPAYPWWLTPDIAC